MPIRTRLIIIFLSVVIIPMSFVGAITYLNARETLEQTTLAGLHGISEFMEAKIFLYLDKLKARTADFSSDGYIRDSVIVITSQDSKERVEKLNTHLIKNKKSLDENIVRIDILDMNGKIIASTDSQKIGANRHNERYFIKGKEEVYITDIHKESGRTVLEISAPLKDRIDPGKSIGVIVNCYSAMSFNELFTGKTVLKMGAKTQMVSFGKTGETYLVNQKSLMLTSSLFIEDAVLNQKVDTYPVRKGFEDNQETKGIWPDYRGIPVIGSSMLINLGDFKWVLLSEQDVAEAFIPIDNLRKLLIIFGIIVVLIVVPVALSVSQSISKPIQVLHKGAERIGGGDLDYRVGTNEKDEIGQLSREFDKMAGALEKRIHEIVMISDALKASNQQLKASEQQLKASNQQLRAGEQQLKASNQQLRAGEQQLKASNQQLRANEQQTKKHLHDLEVFYKANIGREERVVELKKKIKELEEKLGKKTG